MHSIGIMQGRLTPWNGKAIQFFPFDNWKIEFHHANEIGLNEIEFIFDHDRYQENPLWTKKGRDAIAAIINRTNVTINFICADYFMSNPFFRCDVAQYDKNHSLLLSIIDWAIELGIKGIEIPFVDNSSIKTSDEKNVILNLLESVIPKLEANYIFIGLETDLNPQSFKDLLTHFSHPLIRANYDTGNSSGIGYNPTEELDAYGSFIANVHIKDRLLGNGTVELGTGSAQFDAFFSALARQQYSGSFILQAARGEDGNEKEWIAKQKAFLTSYLINYF